ncbi:MAG: helix-turn-helix domain-containing protein [Sphingobium sp.]|nr:MAG: helix-turn-helix domain-containing protein [Sphingobium sp.]
MELASDLLAGVPAIAQHLGKTERATYHLIYNKQLPHFKIGGRIHARKSEIDAAYRSAVSVL